MTGPGYGEIYTYDTYGRLVTRTVTADSTYQFDYTYNATIGLPETLTYPVSTAGQRFKVKYGYASGRLSSIQDYTNNVNGAVLWNLNLLDAQSHAISETYANGLWLQNTYDSLTGLPLTRKSGTGGSDSNVQNLSYTWDTSGNLTGRADLRQNLAESFTYDALDRMTLASGPGAQSLSVTYNAIGNIASKTGIGTYTYDAIRKHAVTAAGGTAYLYDANGNMGTRGGAALTWASYDLPVAINDPGGFNSQFAYAPDRSRWRQVATYSNGTETTIHVGGLLEKLTVSATARTHWKHLIATPSGQVQVIRRSDGTSDVLYFATDHLGSVDVVTNSGAAVVARLSHAAHGARRNGATWIGAPTSAEWLDIANTTRRGFTGHEHLDNISLVHMNGRVYDPRLGRFLSADPYIDGVVSTQGWNRYSYVHNSPLSGVDPTGFQEALETFTVTGTRLRNAEPEFDLTTFLERQLNAPRPEFTVEVRARRIRERSMAPVTLSAGGTTTPQSQQPAQPSQAFRCAQSASADADRVATPVGLAAAGSQFGVPGLVLGAGVGLLATTLRGGFNGDPFATNAIDGLGAVATDRGNPSAFFGTQVTNYVHREVAGYPAFAYVGGGAAGSVATHVLTTRRLAGAAGAARYGAIGGAAYLASFAAIYNYSYRICMEAASGSD